MERNARDKIKMTTKMKLILASQSPRRKELLEYLNIPFQILTADLEEVSRELIPSLVAMDIAAQKAEAIYKRYLSVAAEAPIPFFLLSADTIVLLGEKIYGKPTSVDDARDILSELSGRTHTVMTGVNFLYRTQDGQQKEHRFYESTAVTFNVITTQLMDNYLRTKDSLDKAGAYGIQGPSLTFIHSLTGSYSNVVGLPLDRVVTEIEKLLGRNWRANFE